MKIALMAQTVLILFISGCERSPVGELSLPEGTFQHVVLSEEIVWKPCPQNLPAGCKVAVLEGNPQTPGLFTLRFKVGDNFIMPPHTHPREERVTVLSGQVSVAFGSDGSREGGRQFGPGDYYVNVRDAVHTVWADEESEVQITGLGPWEVHFVE